MKTIDLLFKTLWIPDKNKLQALESSNALHINYDNLITLNDECINPVDNNHDNLKATIRNIPSENIKNTTLDKAESAVSSANLSTLPKTSTLPIKSIIPQKTELTTKLTWEELEYNSKNCHMCNLCADRRNVVIERGNRNAKWMFIGEAPGEQEDLQGKPFVGASGQLLDKMISAINLNHETDVYIANIIKCRPPQNRNPNEQEIEMCKNYILNQIELVKPQIIILLGRFAIQTILSTTNAVGKLRGTVHKFNSNIPVIATYHPSYLLRTPSAKREAWNDLQLAMKVFANLN